MGENMLTGTFIMKTKDGQEIQFENAIINEITENKQESEYCSFDENFYNPKVTNTQYEFNMPIGNITKKRFIKLLMSKGIARNGAKDIASYVYKKYGCYNQIHLLLI